MPAILYEWVKRVVHTRRFRNLTSWPGPVVMAVLLLFVIAGPVWAEGLYNPVETMGGGPWAKPTINLDMANEKVITAEDIETVKPQIDYYKNYGIRYGGYLGMWHYEPNDDAVFRQQFPAVFNGDAGYSVDLDGNKLNQLNILRPAWQNALKQLSKNLIDAGTEWISYDVARSSELSFDSDSIQGFSSFLGSTYSVGELIALGALDANATDKTGLTGFDYGAYLRSQGYSASTLRDDTWPNDGLWMAWLRYHQKAEYDFISALTTELKAYADAKGQDLKLMGNRWDGSLNWTTLGLWDIVGGETFLTEDATAQEPYPQMAMHPLMNWGAAFGKPYWSWNHPRESVSPTDNTAELYLAESIAAGGLYQVGIDIGGVTDTEMRSKLVQYTDFVSKYRQDLGGSQNSEIGIWYYPREWVTGPTTENIRYVGTAQLMADLHFRYSVAGQPGPDALYGPTKTLTLDAISKFPVLVVPDRAGITQDMADILLNYAGSGKKLILIGPPSSTTLEDYVDGTWQDYGSGSILGLVYNAADGASVDGINYMQNVDSRSAIRTTLSAALGTTVQPGIVTDLPATVDVFNYSLTDGSKIFHLVNYNLDSNKTMIGVPEGSTFTVPVLTGYASPTATFLTPGMAPQELTVTDLGDGTLTVNLPGFNVWGVLKLGSGVQSAEVNPAPISKAKSVFSYDEWQNASNQTFTIDYNSADDTSVSSVALYYHRPAHACSDRF